MERELARACGLRISTAMTTRELTTQHALDVLVAEGVDPAQCRRILDALSRRGFNLAEDTADELVCRWVDVEVQPVPPDADTIIRTITTTLGSQSWSKTHWLDGLRSPRTSRPR
jgi:hypothetical protein